MVKQINLKYGIIFGFVDLIITLLAIYLTTDMRTALGTSKV